MYYAMGYGATDSGDMKQYTGFDNQVEGAAELLKKLWLEAPSSSTLSVNNGKSHTRNGITYPICSLKYLRNGGVPGHKHIIRGDSV